MGSWKLKKRCFPENFDSCIANNFWFGHIFRISQKNEKGKEKVVSQGEDIQKVAVQLPYTWGYVDSINRIRRSKLKVVVVVEVGGNQKAISGGMGRVFPFIYYFFAFLEKEEMRSGTRFTQQNVFLLFTVVVTKHVWPYFQSSFPKTSSERVSSWESEN